MKDTAIFMFGIQGTELSQQEIDYLQHPLSAGVILFSRNFVDKAQISKLINQIREQAVDDTLIAIDHEGGRVQRFREGFTAIPPMAELGKRYDKDPDQALQYSTLLGSILAYELAEIDVDFSFAPVLDVQNPISTIIGDRAFHADTLILSKLAVAFYQGLKQAGFAGVGKHFPGHGNIEADSHLTLPEDYRSLETLYNEDLIPFKQLIDNGIEGIMPAHVLYTRCDGMPAGFSNFWLQHVLRNKYQFDGCIISDDLDMAGAAAFGDIHARIDLARKNCDLILLCNDKEHIDKAFNNTPINNCPKRLARLLALQRKVSKTNQQDYQNALSAVGDFLDLTKSIG